MAQYGLPISDLTHTGWAQGAGDGNATHFEELDEGFGAGRGSGSGPDDATTYWYGTGSDLATINSPITSLTDPATNTGHIIRHRVVKTTTAGVPNASGQQVDARIAILQPGFLRASQTLVGVTGTWTTDTYTLSGTEADTLDSYTNLELQTRMDQVGGGSARTLGVSAQEFECPDAAGGPSVGVPILGAEGIHSTIFGGAVIR